MEERGGGEFVQAVIPLLFTSLSWCLGRVVRSRLLRWGKIKHLGSDLWIFIVQAKGLKRRRLPLFLCV